MLSPTFLAASLLVILIPGTGVIYTISNGLLHGKRQSIYAATGCTIGILPHLVLGILCLSVLGNISTLFFIVLKILGTLYLFYMGIKMVLENDLGASGQNAPQKSAGEVILAGIMINLLNPKLTLFFLAFLPQFVVNDPAQMTWHAIILGLTFMFLTFIVFIIYGVLASTILKTVGDQPHILKASSKIFGILFILLALQLGFSNI